MRPISRSDGHDRIGLVDELVPGLATGLEDGAVIFEDAVRAPVLPEILPDVLDRVQLGRSRGQQDDGEVVRNLELVGAAPALVEQKNSIGPPRHPMALPRVPYHRLQGRAFLRAQKSTAYHANAKNRFAAGLPELFSGP